MYRQLGLRATVLGASASGAAGVAGAAPDLPGIVRILLLLMTISMALYLAISFVLVALTLIFRLTARPRPSHLRSNRTPQSNRTRRAS